MRRIVAVLVLVLAGCALPAKESLRLRGVDIYANGGRDRYGGPFDNGHGSNWSVGANLHWDVIYGDEYELAEDE